ncbi:protein kinase [Streptomyces sp. NPDC048643]|uniref:serine/threonine-protein kinase n=1 Tax=Streptomyces sp. NPDC048643 TaxID=3155637 RepID=UPI00342B9D72
MTGRYRLVESIGQGGMGRVWRAADEMLDRQVAVKEMRIDGLDPEDTRTRRERTLREARATARIDHPGVVRIYDVVDASERLWIVMELVAGRSLERIVVEDGPLDPREAARVGLELVGALRQVHAGGVLHRDIKPGNVLVERAGRRRVVLTDFGIAALQDAEALTMAGMLVGSPDYMAPERISGRPQGPPSDVWSLGATLCAALGGRSPFSRATTYATLHAVLYEEPVLPAAAGALRDILAALLEKEPDTRPGLEELETALEEIARPPVPGTAATRPLTEGPEYDFTDGVEFGPAYGRTRNEVPERPADSRQEPDPFSPGGQDPGRPSAPDHGPDPHRPATPEPARTSQSPPTPEHGPATPVAGPEPGHATTPATEHGRPSTTTPSPDRGPDPARPVAPRSGRGPGSAPTPGTGHTQTPAAVPGPGGEPDAAHVSPPRSGRAPGSATPGAGAGQAPATAPSTEHVPAPARTAGPRSGEALGSAPTPDARHGQAPATAPSTAREPGPGYRPTVVSPGGPVPESPPARPVREPDSRATATSTPVSAPPTPSEPASAPAHDPAPGRRAASDSTTTSEPRSTRQPAPDQADLPAATPGPTSEPTPAPSPDTPPGREPGPERRSPRQLAPDARKVPEPSAGPTDKSAPPEADPTPAPEPAPASSPTRALLDARRIRATRLPADLPEATPPAEEPLSDDPAEGSSPAEDLPQDGGTPADPREHPSVQDAVPVPRRPTSKSAPDFRKHPRARSAEGVLASDAEALTRDRDLPATANASTEAPSEPRGEPRSETPPQLPTAPVSVLPPRRELPHSAGQSAPAAGSPPGSGEDTGTATGAGRRGGRRRVVLAAAGVVVAGAVAGIVLALSGGGSPEGGSAASPGASSAATASSAGGGPTSASPTVEGTSRPPSLPPGAHREAGGYAWVTPKGWRRDLQTGSEVHYTSPDGAQELAAKSSLARGNLMDTWQTSEQNARQGRDYRKIRLEETTFQGRPAIVWEYTFTIKGVRWHARLLGFDVDGKSYQINTWYHRDIEDRAVATYNRVKKSFTVL